MNVAETHRSCKKTWKILVACVCEGDMNPQSPDDGVSDDNDRSRLGQGYCIIFAYLDLLYTRFLNTKHEHEHDSQIQNKVLMSVKRMRRIVFTDVHFRRSSVRRRVYANGLKLLEISSKSLY